MKVVVSIVVVVVVVVMLVVVVMVEGVRDLQKEKEFLYWGDRHRPGLLQPSPRFDGFGTYELRNSEREGEAEAEGEGGLHIRVGEAMSVGGFST